MPRETLGAILKSKKFLVYILCLSVSFCLILVNSVNHLWVAFYALHAVVFKALVLCEFVAFFGSVCLLMSWLLADDGCCLEKAVLLFLVGVIMTICGAYYTIEFLEYGSDFYVTLPLSVMHHASWLPVMGVVHFIVGIFTVLLFIYVILTWDS